MTSTVSFSPSPSRSVTVSHTLLRWVGRLALFIGFVLALLLMFSGAFSQGLIVFGLTLVIVPLLSLLVTLIWRFFWHLVVIALAVVSIVLVGGWWGIMMGAVRLPGKAEALTSLIARGNPFGVILAVVLAGLVAASVGQVHSLWQAGGLQALRNRLIGRRGDALFNFETLGPSSSSLATASLGERVMHHLTQMGHRGEIQGDLIRVYKSRDFVGIVRVVESAGAISPLIVKDVEKQRSKLGVKVAYLATAGWFTDEVRQMADQIGVKLITV